MLEMREVKIVDDKFFVDFGKIRDAWLRVSVLGEIRDCDGFFLLDYRQPLRPRWSKIRTIR